MKMKTRAGFLLASLLALGLVFAVQEFAELDT